MTIYEVAGLLGVLFYLGSYFALQLSFLEGSGYPYASLNLIAASLILVSMVSDFNLWSAIIQVSWILISVIGMTVFYLRTRSISFNEEERDVIAAKLFQLSPIDARKFLSAGRWWTAEPGTVVATEGEVIGQLHYLAEGSALATLHGRVIGEVEAKRFIGELTCLSGDPASATVIIDQPARVFSIDTPTLRGLCTKRPDMRLQIENVMKLDTHQKLLAANARLVNGAEVARSSPLRGNPPSDLASPARQQ